MDFVVRFFMKLTCQDAFRWSEDVSTCHPNDIAALRGFFLGLSSVVRSWPGTISNFTGNCCYWHGIHCEQAEGRVVRVELGGISLRSGLALSSPCLVWIDSKLSISPITLLQATCPLSCSIRKHLQVLDLSFSKLHGHFPLNRSLPSLRVFNISSNSLTGVISSSPQLSSVDNICHRGKPFPRFFG